MRESLRFSAAMLSELRTSQLSPQKYFELHMMIFDPLSELEVRPRDLGCKGRDAWYLFYGAGSPCPSACLEHVGLPLLHTRSGLHYAGASADPGPWTKRLRFPCFHPWLPCPCLHILLQAFFGDERSKGRAYSELYELVQHAGNVLPRL